MNDMEKAGTILTETEEDLQDHQYLTFLLEDEMFAVGVLEIREIIEYAMITKVPSMSDYIKGITNVRGNVIPVIDLPGRLGFNPIKIGKKTCIIIVEVNLENTTLEIGLLVDSVNQVYEILPQMIEEKPSFGAKIRKDFIAKMGKIEDSFIVILNLERVLNVEELSVVTTKNKL
jgi:purine-binding chemotaxis protein CheW